MPKLAVVNKAAPIQSEPRAILAVAIKAARDAKHDESEQREALDRTKRHRSEAVRLLDQANRDAEEAKAAFANEMALPREDRSPILGGVAIQDTRAAISRAQDVVDAASQAVELMGPVLLQAEYVTRSAQEKVKLAAHAVAEAEVTRLLDEARKARAEFVRAFASVDAVASKLHISWTRQPAVDAAHSWARSALYFGDEPEGGASAKWTSFFFDLQEDASTPLPG